MNEPHKHILSGLKNLCLEYENISLKNTLILLSNINLIVTGCSYFLIKHAKAKYKRSIVVLKAEIN